MLSKSTFPTLQCRLQIHDTAYPATLCKWSQSSNKRCFHSEARLRDLVCYEIYPWKSGNDHNFYFPLWCRQRSIQNICWLYGITSDLNNASAVGVLSNRTFVCTFCRLENAKGSIATIVEVLMSCYTESVSAISSIPNSHYLFTFLN